MKKFYLTAFTLLLVTISFANPRITAIIDGNWNSSATWDLHRAPTDNDSVVIPSGKTVTLTSMEQDNNLYITVSGVLYMNGGKLKLDISSDVIVFAGGTITSTGSSSEKIWIGNVEKWRGSDANVIGPMYANQNTGNGFVPFAQGISLPVKFIGFNVARQNNNVLIDWATAQEINSSYYDIQRSENGNDWTSITTVSAAGTTSSTHTYSYTDRNATAKLLYYRIRQVDIDGKSIITPVRMIKNDNSATTDIKISSTATGTVYVHFSSQLKSNVMISVRTINGQTVSQQTINNPVGQVIMLVKNSIQGICIVTVTDGQSLQYSKQVML
jgi:hypothetical protein